MALPPVSHADRRALPTLIRLSVAAACCGTGYQRRCADRTVGAAGALAARAGAAMVAQVAAMAAMTARRAGSAWVSGVGVSAVPCFTQVLRSGMFRRIKSHDRDGRSAVP